MELRSERLIFREFEPKDYSLFSSIFSNETIMKFAYMDQIVNENEMASYFNKVVKNTKNIEKKDSYEFAVFLSSNDYFIGFADILVCYQLSRIKHGEIGYFLLPDYWGKGYATEIAKTLVNTCFVNLNMHKAVASCNANNPQSEKVMQKIGMIKEGELRKERYKNGRWDNELWYGILLEEWGKTCNKDGRIVCDIP